MRFHPGGISNCVAGTAPAPIDVVSTVISAACAKPGAGPLPAEPLDVGAGEAAASVFFLVNRPLTNLLPKVLAAELRTDPAAPLPAALVAAAPAAEPAAPAAESVAAVPAA